jgi:hypothetical protein
MTTMRKIALVSAIVLAPAFGDTANADPYRWCAEYGGGRGGATNCYFVTLQQCQAAVSGNGGFCRQNTFYTGPDRRRGYGAYGMDRRW